MSSQMKTLNLLALLLLVINSSIALTIKLETKTRTQWGANKWMQLENGSVKVYTSKDNCYQGCPGTCKWTSSWRDTRRLFKTEEDYLFCLINKTALTNAEVIFFGKRFIEEDICYSYCQPMHNKRCYSQKLKKIGKRYHC